MARGAHPRAAVELDKMQRAERICKVGLANQPNWPIRWYPTTELVNPAQLANYCTNWPILMIFHLPYT
jgi:hypothetical protein